MSSYFQYIIFIVTLYQIYRCNTLKIHALNPFWREVEAVWFRFMVTYIVPCMYKHWFAKLTNASQLNSTNSVSCDNALMGVIATYSYRNNRQWLCKRQKRHNLVAMHILNPLSLFSYIKLWTRCCNICYITL